MMASRNYDMTSTMYSPDGRIYQVEYAIETVKRGALAVGVCTKEGVVIAVEEKPRTLQTRNVTQKIFQVDKHIGVAAAGYIPDARVEVDNARFFSQGTRMTYDEPVEVATVAKHLADHAHQFTQYGGVRPNGVSMIIGGIDQKGGSIYVIDPSGAYMQYTAVAIGAGSDDVNDFLEKNYGPDMGMEDGVRLAIGAINLKLDKKSEVAHIKMARIPDGTQEFEKMSDESLQELAGKMPEFSA